MDFPPVYGTLNENQLLRAQQNQEGDTDFYRLLSRYTSFWQKHDVLVQNCQINVYRGFSASIRYIERKSAIDGTTKPRGEYRYTVYCHGMPLSGKKYDVAVHFDLVFEDARVF